ncbi:nucleotidyltransferase domain-containing protein [Micromonospora haikouensis]|uniref:nucleotidyltransferase domain-containing protein n=1 Tax=Micromonospora haikouensis TaxID=686309 RepID=UPI000B035CAC|nr:nucleotidyltransferase domain-containing protein [Micromonospora haikouensis]
MDTEVERYLTELVTAAGEVLGEDLVGASAAGSVALGAYQPGRSDVDVALLCARALPAGRKRELVARLRHEALPCPARGLELVVYRRDVARSGTPEPGFEVELNTGARMPPRVTWSGDERPAADGRFWYGLDRSILHAGGSALLGPPAGEAFADLTPADLRPAAGGRADLAVGAADPARRRAGRRRRGRGARRVPRAGALPRRRLAAEGGGGAAAGRAGAPGGWPDRAGDRGPGRRPATGRRGGPRVPAGRTRRDTRDAMTHSIYSSLWIYG